ncbi:MAG TPA: hypothetical protein VII06_30945 [Chloroflexota bacterium]
MAQVSEAVRQDVERLLDRLSDEWGRLPEVAAEIDTWDWADAVVFIEECTLEEDCLRRLEQYVADGALTPGQLARYKQIQALVAQNRPIIQRLRES